MCTGMLAQRVMGMGLGSSSPTQTPMWATCMLMLHMMSPRTADAFLMMSMTDGSLDTGE